MENITIKKVEFKHFDEWDFSLKRNDIITPVWKRGKCVMLLITRRKTGEAVYVTANTREILLKVGVNVLHTPHGVTYMLNEDAHVNVLGTMISLYKLE